VAKPHHYLEGFIERFTDDQAVIRHADRNISLVERSRLPDGTQVGDFIVQIDDAGHFRVDQEITEMRQQELRRMSDGYFG
jgi:hypothetical protein